MARLANEELLDALLQLNNRAGSRVQLLETEFLCELAYLAGGGTLDEDGDIEDVVMEVMEEERCDVPACIRRFYFAGSQEALKRELEPEAVIVSVN
jgi:hypothetical protein